MTATPSSSVRAKLEVSCVKVAPVGDVACELFIAGSCVADGERKAALEVELQKINMRIVEMGANEEFVKTYYHKAGGRCVRCNSMLCSKHESSPPPLPPGFMDEEVFKREVETLDERIVSQTRVVEDLKVEWTTYSTEKKAGVDSFLNISQEDKVIIRFSLTCVCVGSTWLIVAYSRIRRSVMKLSC
jgi:hypothetical protein